MATVDARYEENEIATLCNKTKVMLVTTYQKEIKLNSIHSSLVSETNDVSFISGHVQQH